MFTGIVEELGEVVAIEMLPGNAARITVRTSVVASDAVHGSSVAVNGVCLTVTDTDGVVFTADVMAETLSRSELGTTTVGADVNLERPVTLQTRLGGHLVQGHVDGVGEIIRRESTPHWDLVTIRLPHHLMRYVVEKGSITVDGVSLTVASVGGDDVTVSLIPTTLTLTTLGRKGIGARVNIEVDMMAKYVERMLSWTTQ